MSDIVVKRSENILDVQLNRPSKRNAMTSSMYVAMADVLDGAAKDDETRVVLWHGAGDSFSAGNDLEDFMDNPPGPGASPQSRLIDALIRFEKPLVAAVQGAAIGGGTTMLAHCDFVYAGESAKFQLPFVDLALVPEFGSSYLLPLRFGYVRAAELILLGRPFDALRAAELGLVTKVVPDRNLLAVANQTAEHLAKKPPRALQACKRLMRRALREQLEQAVSWENEEFATRVRSEEAKEAFTAFLATHRRARVWHEGVTIMESKLFFLDLSTGRVFAMNPDGSDRKTIVEGRKRLPDGIDVDVDAGHLYLTYMGNPSANDGSIVRADLDGRNLTTIVPDGATFTPKQLRLEKKSRKLYWCDREGMRVMRANLDGSRIETLVQTGESATDRRDQRNWCVGIAVDHEGGKLYWTQKGADNAEQGRILRANLELPEGESAANRTDIEVLFDGLPEPIDLDLDLAQGMLYWTDRGDPPRGNTVNRAPIDARLTKSTKPEVLFTHLMEGIGLTLDLRGRRMFITDLGGSVYTANLDGSNAKVLAIAQGNLSGIAYAEFPGER